MIYSDIRSPNARERAHIGRRTPPNRGPAGPRRLVVQKWRQYHRLDSGWHVVLLRPVPEDAAGCVDARLGRRVAEIPVSERIRTYGHNAYAHVCRPCNQHELDEVHCLSSAALVSQR
jgi:hypothetical protein